MMLYDDALTSLAARVRGGDTAAVPGLREQLEPRLRPVVRQVLRIGPDGSALDRRILREVTRTAGAHGALGGRDRESLVAQVARRVCSQVIADLGRNGPAGQAHRDTVKNV
jgi:hypothetical protein